MGGCACFAGGVYEVWESVVSSLGESRKGDLFVNLAQRRAFHGGTLGAPVSFLVSHSHELPARCHATSSLGWSSSDLHLQP